MLVLCAPDKYKGTASAQEAAEAMATGVAAAGHAAARLPLADGGEGTLEAFGGPNRTTRVTGPLGGAVDAAWRLDGDLAIVEMSRASGLTLAGGADGNDSILATTAGTGELIGAAVASGAKRIVVAVGGSATTDGGAGALGVLHPERLLDVELVVACDVRTKFLDAADVFAPQKGAGPAEVAVLADRLHRLAAEYRDRFGRDVTTLEGSGAAGGLAGGLAALGARLVDGFELVAEHVGLRDHVRACDLVLTGEGCLDASSFAGKVVGGVAAAAASEQRRLAVIAGRVARRPADLRTVELIELVGEANAFGRTTDAIAQAARVVLSAAHWP